MQVDRQSAETIYNIAGDMHLHTSLEVVKILNDEKQNKLNELYTLSFLDSLEADFSSKKLLYREQEINSIKALLVDNGQLMLIGEPGLGKTTLLFQLAKEIGQVVYISVKSKSPISIIAYLVNKIRLFNNESLLEIKDINEAYEWLQLSLQKSSQYFIIDDCEKDIDTVSRLINLDKFQTHFLFASRNKTVFEPTSIEYYPCSPFGSKEISEFLSLYGIRLGALEVNEIEEASNGNPLYLYYFSQFQISPLPASLASYQTSIWKSLTSQQQEILAIISITYIDVKVDEIAEIISNQSLIAIANEIDELSTLVENNNGKLDVFHPSFREFIVAYLDNKGILKNYKVRLGNFFLKKEKILDAIYLLIDVAPEKVDEYLFDVFPILISSGELVFADKVLKRKLHIVKKNIEKGYLCYHLCYLHNLLGNKTESSNYINQALGYFKKSNSKKFYTSALLFKAMSLIEEGDIEGAIVIADDVLYNISKNTTTLQGVLYVNLSKIYVDLFEFEKGAIVCKKAFELFEKQKNRHGMINSLCNLVTCLSQLKGRGDEAEKYGLYLFDIIEQEPDVDVSIEMVVLNALASVNREKKDYTKAREYSLRAIKLCQKYGMKDKVILNFINYGNILRDAGEQELAKDIYNDALLKAKDSNLEREEARIYWILADMYTHQGEYQLGIESADKSIELSKKLSFYYGAANALDGKSETLLLLNEPVKAAESLVESAEFYKKMNHFSSSYTNQLIKAVKIYSKIGKIEDAGNIIEKLLSGNEGDVHSDDIIDAIVDNPNENFASEKFIQLFKTYIQGINRNLNFIRIAIAFISFCNAIDKMNGKRLFTLVINDIADNVGESKYLFSILGVMIEQSGELLNKEDCMNIIDKVRKNFAVFNVRSIDPENIYIVSIDGKINLEIRAFTDELICNKLILALVFLIKETPNLIINKIVPLEGMYKAKLWGYTDEINTILSDHLPADSELFDEFHQTVHMEKRNYKIEDMVFVSANYEVVSSLSKSPENKSSLYFFSTALLAIKSHFYHTQEIKIDAQRRFVMDSVASYLGYNATDIESESVKSRFEVNINTIELIKYRA